MPRDYPPEYQINAQSARSLADHQEPASAAPRTSAEDLERTAAKVERAVDALEGLLHMIIGQRNAAGGTAEAASQPRPAPILAHALEQVPMQIENQCDRANALMKEIRQALRL